MSSGKSGKESRHISWTTFQVQVLRGFILSVHRGKIAFGSTETEAAGFQGNGNTKEQPVRLQVTVGTVCDFRKEEML